MEALAESTPTRVLIVDDDGAVRLLFKRLLERRGFEVEAIGSLSDLRELAQHGPYGAILLDMYLDDGVGLEALHDVYRAMPLTKIVILTAEASIDLAVRSMNDGVSGFLSKNEPATETVRKFEQLLAEGPSTGSSFNHALFGGSGIVGSSRALHCVLARIERIRNVESTVLLLGESGVGKELIARAIHDSSRRRGGPFVAINCAAIPDHLLEAELFGYKKGAFTDAKTDRKGFFEVCSEGTLLLDEIGEMSPNLQAKLLRVLQEREFIPIGSSQSLKVNTRVIAATNRNIESAIAGGRFREDLYYRLSVIRLDLPPLRERKEDIPSLVATFVDAFNRQFGKSVRPPSPRILARLKAYDWPGNVRELRNAVERAVIMAEGQLMHIEDLLPCNQMALKPVSTPIRGAIHELPLKFADAKRDFERTYLAGILKLAGGNIAEAARLSGQYRTNIYRLMSKYSLDQGAFKR